MGKEKRGEGENKVEGWRKLGSRKENVRLRQSTASCSEYKWVSVVCFRSFAGKIFYQGGILLFLLCLFDACGGQPCALSSQCGYIEESMWKMYLSRSIHIALRYFIVYTQVKCGESNKAPIYIWPSTQLCKEHLTGKVSFYLSHSLNSNLIFFLLK